MINLRLNDSVKVLRNGKTQFGTIIFIHSKGYFYTIRFKDYCESVLAYSIISGEVKIEIIPK